MTCFLCGSTSRIKNNGENENTSVFCSKGHSFFYTLEFSEYHMDNFSQKTRDCLRAFVEHENTNGKNPVLYAASAEACV